MNEVCESLKKQRKSNKIKLIIYQVLVLVGFFGVWELLAYFHLINVFVFSSPSAVFKTLIEYIKTDQLFKHVWISIYETVFGIIIGSVTGIFIAAVLWYWRRLTEVLQPFLNVLNALPKTALAPIMIIWAGAGAKGIVLVAISILIIITILSTLNYFNNVEEDKIKMMKSFGASRKQLFTKLIFPSNFGNLATVVKINIGMSWIGVIVGELLVSKAGIGYLIMYGGQIFKMDLVMMGVFILSIAAFLMYVMVDKLEKIIIKKRGEKM